MARRRIYSVEDLRGLSEAEREERAQALRAIRRARDDFTPVEDAADELGVDMDSVRRWAEEALEPIRPGVTFPSETDRIVRFHPLAVDGEVDLVAVEGPEELEQAADILDVQYRWVEGRATRDEVRNLPATFKGQTVVRDPAELDAMARAGEFNLEEKYREILG
jgi:hypothetical protein